MDMNEQKIECPKCGYRFPVTEALASQVEDRLRSEFEAKTKEKEGEMKATLEKRVASELSKMSGKVKEEARVQAEKSVRASYLKETEQLQKQVRESQEQLKEAKKQALELQKREKQIENRERDIKKEMHWR
jgi:hypothetical protein